MYKNLKVLGIETSCDDTSVAIVDSNKNILTNIVYNQNNLHMKYQGIVPEIAARQHLVAIASAIEEGLDEACLSIRDIDIVAATAMPGLIGGLLVGVSVAKSIAYSANKPFIAINHLEGHALTARLCYDVSFPFLLLLISGGHCQTMCVESATTYHMIGCTRDDALGEAFDKVARMLDLPFPGGPEIEKCAKLGDPDKFTLPIPMKGSEHFSFSGLKTAVRRIIEGHVNKDKQFIYDICASFQNVVSKILIDKICSAIKIYSTILSGRAKRQLVVAGGVAANQFLKESICNLCSNIEFEAYFPPPRLCTDNGAMIAWAAIEKYNVQKDLAFSSLETEPSSNSKI